MNNYNLNRQDIKNGDILLYSGSGFFSGAIKLFTGSEYSHAGIAVWWNDRLMVLESVGKGMIATPLSKNVKKYPGRVDLFRTFDHIPDNDREMIVRHAQQKLGDEYSKWKLIVFTHKMIWGARPRKDGYKKSNNWYCSHIVAASYNYAGYDLVDDLADDFTSPEDIRGSEKTFKVVTLKNN
jgi:hypothetical protein